MQNHAGPKNMSKWFYAESCRAQKHVQKDKKKKKKRQTELKSRVGGGGYLASLCLPRPKSVGVIPLHIFDHAS
jgi:hypothetical protein